MVMSACYRQLALKALNERLRSVPAGTSWPSMEEDSETASSAVTERVESTSSTLPVPTDVNSDTPDTPAAVSAASSSASEPHDQQH